MAKLIYSAITSLDGYVADDAGTFDWAHPDEEVHAFVNDLARPIGTYLYGRRMFEVMRFWESADGDADQPPVIKDFATIWQAADKVVYSTHPAGAYHGEDPRRAGVRPGCGPADEGRCGP